MSKSKKESIQIINKEFKGLINNPDIDSLFLALDRAIKAISGSEFSLILSIDNDNREIKTYINQKYISIKLEKSIVDKVAKSKRAFFDNYLVSNKNYNPKIDNILKIDIKSMIVVPIIDKIKGEVVAFILAFNSVDYKGEFKRYDTRSLGLLKNHVLKLVKKLDTSIVKIALEDKIETTSLIDRNLIDTKASIQNINEELEAKLKSQQARIEELENELLLKDKLLEINVSPKEEYLVTVVEDEENVVDSDIHTILDFLTNEVVYLSNEEHQLYLFLEIIKNSLHNKEQLDFINSKLDKNSMVEELATQLYTREKMPIIFDEFNIHQLVNHISLLYANTFFDKNITFNIFVEPSIPTLFYSDKRKIQSLIIHLINNALGFTNEGGAIELDLSFLESEEIITIVVKGIKHFNKQDSKHFFKKSKITSTVTSPHKGIGLSVSSNLIKLLDGKLKLSRVGENIHLFTSFLPIRKIETEEIVNFLYKNNIKVAILSADDDIYVLENLVKYLKYMEINKESIYFFKSIKSMGNSKFSHLFCFEDMLSYDIKFKNFSSVTVFRNSQKPLTFGVDNLIHEIDINSYYGLQLKRILFPNVDILELEENTLFIKDSFLSKFSNVIKKLKLR